MVKLATSLFFITPFVYSLFWGFFEWQYLSFVITIVLFTCILSFTACLPYYFYPEDIKKYVVLGGSIGINLMYIISMLNASKTIIGAEFSYIFTPLAAIPPLFFMLSDFWKSKDYKPHVYLFSAMIISIVSMLPILAEISREIDMLMDW